jgi:hypothetical protein
MMKRWACVITGTATFYLNGAICQASVVTLRGNDTDEDSPNTERHRAVAKTSDPRVHLPGGNPLWGIPISSLSATRERPIFSASRRPPAPMPVAEAPPPPPAEPEHPPFTLVGTAIGKSQK